jgi:hypothetical protein
VVEHVGPDGQVSRLPAGERVLWTGHPTTRGLLKHLLRVGWVLAFVVLTFGLQAAEVMRSNDRVLARLVGIGVLNGVLAAIAAGSLWFLASRLAKSSQYVITNRRVYFKVGVVLQADANVPFQLLDGVDLRRRRDGTGDVLMTLGGPEEIPWLLLFPHLSWRRSRRGRPTFRSLAKPDAVATILVQALQEYHAQVKAGAIPQPDGAHVPGMMQSSLAAVS